MNPILKDSLWLASTIALAIALVWCFILLQNSYDESQHLQVQLTKLQNKSDNLSQKNDEIVDSMIQMNRALQSQRTKQNSSREKLFADYFAFRGNELMNNSRYLDAAASFEIVIRNQPKNVVFVEKLLECYSKLEHEEKILESKKKLAALIEEFRIGIWNQNFNLK